MPQELSFPTERSLCDYICDITTYRLQYRVHYMCIHTQQYEVIVPLMCFSPHFVKRVCTTHCVSRQIQ